MAPRATTRGRDEILRSFAGLELIDPGLVQVPYWRPGGRSTAMFRHDLEVSSAHASAFTSQVYDGASGAQGVGVVPAQDPHLVGQQLLGYAQGLRPVSARAGPECDVGAGRPAAGSVSPAAE